MADRVDPELVPDPDSVQSPQSAGHDGVVEPSDADPDRRQVRAEIGKYVSLTGFPSRAQDLVEGAVAKNAPGEVLEWLQTLPSDSVYGDARELWLALDLESAERF